LSWQFAPCVVLLAHGDAAKELEIVDVLGGLIHEYERAA
jgi:hypothetical protein